MGKIIWLASYPKSGNTWLRTFLANFSRSEGRALNINDLWKHAEDESKSKWYLPYLSADAFLQATTTQIASLKSSVHRDIASQAVSTVYVKSHNFLGSYEGYKLHTVAYTAGSIYIVRNPLDVVVSVADHFGSSIDEAIEFMADDKTVANREPDNAESILCSWSTHVDSWSRVSGAGIHIIRYEDMLEKPVKVFSALTSKLGFSRNKRQLNAAIKFSAFSELRKQEAKGGFIERSGKARKFFRSGRSGQWRKQLNSDQIARIMRDHGDMMAKFNYLPKTCNI